MIFQLELLLLDKNLIRSRVSWGRIPLTLSSKPKRDFCASNIFTATANVCCRYWSIGAHEYGLQCKQKQILKISANGVQKVVTWAHLIHVKKVDVGNICTPPQMAVCISRIITSPYYGGSIQWSIILKLHMLLFGGHKYHYTLHFCAVTNFIYVFLS